MSHASKHIVGLTSLRGIAALFIVLHHFTIILFPDTYKFIPSQFIAKSYLWVDLFFILSGFVLAHVYSQRFASEVRSIDYREFLLARFARIYPVHLFILLLFVVFHVVCSIVFFNSSNPELNHAATLGSQRTLETFVANIVLLQAFLEGTYWNGPAWSISAEWLVYLLIPFLVVGFQGFSRALQMLIFVLGFLVLFAIELGFGDLGMFYAGWPMVVRCLAEASMGIVLYQLYVSGIAARISGHAVTLVFFLTVVSLILPIPHVISIALFLLLVLAATQVSEGSRHWLAHPWLLYLGLISYSIYMTHWLVKRLIQEPTFWLTGRQPGEFLVLYEQFIAVVIAMAAVLVLSHFCYRYIEMPWRKRIINSEFMQRMLGIR